MPEIKMTLGRHSKGSIKLKKFEKALPRNLEKGFNLSGILLKSQIQRHLTGVSATIDKSRKFPGTGTKHGGRLRGSITYQVVKKLKSIGLRVGTRVKYAAIHELGGTIHQVVTKKQRWFLGLSKGIWLREGHNLIIRIPKRPYIWPAWLKRKRDVVNVIQKAVMAPIRFG